VEEKRHIIVYYATVSGRKPVREFLDGLPPRSRDKCLSYIDLLREIGTSLRSSHIKKLEDDLWELRPEYGGIEYRLFFGIDGRRFVFTHGVVKKRQKTARNDIELAQKRFVEWKDSQK